MDGFTFDALDYQGGLDEISAFYGRSPTPPPPPSPPRELPLESRAGGLSGAADLPPHRPRAGDEGVAELEDAESMEDATDLQYGNAQEGNDAQEGNGAHGEDEPAALQENEEPTEDEFARLMEDLAGLPALQLQRQSTTDAQQVPAALQEEEATVMENEFDGLMGHVEQYSGPIQREGSAGDESQAPPLHAHTPGASAAEVDAEYMRRASSAASSDDSVGSAVLNGLQASPLPPSSSAKSYLQDEMRSEENTQDVHELIPPPPRFAAHPGGPLFAHMRSTLNVQDGYAFLQNVPHQQAQPTPNPLNLGYSPFHKPTFPPLWSSDAQTTTRPSNDQQNYSTDPTSAPQSSLLTPEDESPRLDKPVKRRRESSPSEQVSPHMSRPKARQPKKQKVARSMSITSAIDSSPKKTASPRSRNTPKKPRPSNFPPELDNAPAFNLPRPEPKSESKPPKGAAPAAKRRKTIANADIPSDQQPKVEEDKKAILAEEPTETLPPSRGRKKAVKRTNTTTETAIPNTAQPQRTAGGHPVSKTELKMLVGGKVLSGVKKKKPSPRKTRHQRDEEAKVAPNASEAVKRRRSAGATKA